MKVILVKCDDETVSMHFVKKNMETVCEITNHFIEYLDRQSKMKYKILCLDDLKGCEGIKDRDDLSELYDSANVDENEIENFYDAGEDKYENVDEEDIDSDEDKIQLKSVEHATMGMA